MRSLEKRIACCRLSLMRFLSSQLYSLPELSTDFPRQQTSAKLPKGGVGKSTLYSFPLPGGVTWQAPWFQEVWWGKRRIAALGKILVHCHSRDRIEFPDDFCNFCSILILLFFPYLDFEISEYFIFSSYKVAFKPLFHYHYCLHGQL